MTEEILHESIDSRTEVLATLRELGPPDLVQLIKQIPRNPLTIERLEFTIMSQE
ncbi:hypothetical protein BGT96224_2792 [Blumeria graminis f. sp. tritici 96224]|nr:hypothetical protein BGT96224_2792 [Blumeria graminis f. sp. tritici 96224]